MSRPVVMVLSGPNLDLLGSRQPEIYGAATLAQHVQSATEAGHRSGLVVEHVQSNHEGVLIEAVHAARGRARAIIVNAGALTHTSWSLHDALAAFDGVVVELHLSNPAAREPYRHRSVVAPVARGSIAGFGGLGYELAVQAVAALLASEDESGTGSPAGEPAPVGGVGEGGPR
jgi:3-dehydroquinate dehydratase-2